MDYKKIVPTQYEFKIYCIGVVGKLPRYRVNIRIIKRKSPEILRFQDFLVEISGIEPLTS